MKIEPRPARAPKWSLSNENLIENRWKSSPGQPGTQNLTENSEWFHFCLKLSKDASTGWPLGTSVCDTLDSCVVADLVFCWGDPAGNRWVARASSIYVLKDLEHIHNWIGNQDYEVLQYTHLLNCHSQGHIWTLQKLNSHDVAAQNWQQTVCRQKTPKKTAFHYLEPCIRHCWYVRFSGLMGASIRFQPINDPEPWNMHSSGCCTCRMAKLQSVGF